MATIYGRSYTRRELLERVGDISQICSASKLTLRGGSRDGVDAVEFRTGSGFSFTVLPGRGMDIGMAEYGGKSLCWRSSTGEVNPAFFEPQGLGWLRSFQGGLLVTCGLTYLGSPGKDEGAELGLHGRVSNIPAHDVCVGSGWTGDDYWIWASGKVRETVAGAEDIQLTRKISAKLGGNRIYIEDEVENLAHRRVEHMILYHVNMGFPLLDETSELYIPSRSVNVTDGQPADDYDIITHPDAEYKDRVYYHSLYSDLDGNTMVALVNRQLDKGKGIGVYMSFPRKQLPIFVQWKKYAKGQYVMGLEPANCRVGGRALERAEGTLQYLEPFETRRYIMEIGVLDGQDEIDGVVTGIRGMKD